MFKSSWCFLKSLVVGVPPLQRLAVGALTIWAFLSFEVVVGLFWFMVKVFTFAFIFVFMRGTLPRVRIDQLMGFAWKWLVAIALLNIFVTAGAILVIQELSAMKATTVGLGHAGSRRFARTAEALRRKLERLVGPGLGHGQGHGPQLRAACSSPRSPSSTPRSATRSRRTTAAG